MTDKRKDEMLTVTASLSEPSLCVECPHCEHDFDLFDRNESPATADGDGEQSIAWNLFDSWHDRNPRDYDVDCPKCKKEFNVNKVEF